MCLAELAGLAATLALVVGLVPAPAPGEQALAEEVPALAVQELALAVHLVNPVRRLSTMIGHWGCCHNLGLAEVELSPSSNFHFQYHRLRNCSGHFRACLNNCRKPSCIHPPPKRAAQLRRGHVVLHDGQ